MLPISTPLTGGPGIGGYDLKSEAKFMDRICPRLMMEKENMVEMGIARVRVGTFSPRKNRWRNILERESQFLHDVNVVPEPEVGWPRHSFCLSASVPFYLQFKEGD